jgi:hypothetical protein
MEGWLHVQMIVAIAQSAISGGRISDRSERRELVVTAPITRKVHGRGEEA